MAISYSHSKQTRTPAALIGCLCVLILFILAIVDKAPWYFLVPVALAGAMLLWMILVNRKSGMQITDSDLTMHAGKWAQTIPISTIQSVTVKDWMEGAPDITLKLVGGIDCRVPHSCVGSVKMFEAALEDRGISITRN